MGNIDAPINMQDSGSQFEAQPKLKSQGEALSEPESLAEPRLQVEPKFAKDAKPEDQPRSEPETAASDLPDYMTDPDAVTKDVTAAWRSGVPPNYANTRRVYAETKKMNHEPGSLPNLVENLVKNWEIEASFKSKVSEWRTINPEKYTFAINGGPNQSAEKMLKEGTYNGIISPNEYYSPENSDFETSHTTFKKMMPTFAWEVLEVYSGPPKVAFRWRHWGVMSGDYVGFNNKGEKVTAKAHGGPIELEGVTVADLDENMKVTHLETWSDSMDMFRMIAPKGLVTKEPMMSLTESEKEPTKTATTEVLEVNPVQPVTDIPTDSAVQISDKSAARNVLESHSAHNVSDNPTATQPIMPSIPLKVSDAISGGWDPEVAKGHQDVAKENPNVAKDNPDVASKASEAKVVPESHAAEAAEPGVTGTSAPSNKIAPTHEEPRSITEAGCPFMSIRSA